MKILLVGSYYYSMYAPAFAYGFRKLGHDVLEVDYDKFHLNKCSVISTFLNRLQDRFHFGFNMHNYNNAIIKMVKKEKPDIVFLYRCYHVYESTLKAIKGNSVYMSYNNDDPFSCVPSNSYFRYHLRNAKHCDLNYVYRKKNIDDYARIGITNTKILLPYYLSRQNKPISCKKDIPIAFIGHFEEDGRDLHIKKLIDAGIPIQLYGGDLWKKSKYYKLLQPFLYFPVRGDDYNQTINRTRILLVFFSKHNHDTYTRRCFEIPAAKSMMLSEYTDDMNRLFPMNECAVYFKNSEELVEKAKWLLENPLEVERISLNGYNRLLKIGGSEIDRCQQILDDFEIIKEERDKSDQ